MLNSDGCVKGQSKDSGECMRVDDKEGRMERTLFAFLRIRHDEVVSILDWVKCE